MAWRVTAVPSVSRRDREGPVGAETCDETSLTAHRLRDRACAQRGTLPCIFVSGSAMRRGCVSSHVSRRRALSITRLTDGTAVTRQAITRHLHVLASAGLARGIRRGREQLWAIEPEPLDEARRCLDRISSQWDEALGRLKQFIEE